MKTNIIKALFGLILTFSISGLYAQSPRIKLNQIVKDTISGSVLISNLADSNMVYSRNFYINAADTSLIFFGTTIVAGGGGGGSFVTLPQLTDSLALYATKVQLSDSMATVLKQVATDLTLTGDGSVGNPLKVDTTTYIATKGDLTGYVDLTNAQTVGGAKTFSTSIIVNENGDNVDTRFEGDTDANLLFLDASANKVGIGTSSPEANLDIIAPITSATNNQFRIRDVGSNGFFSITEGSSGGNIYIPNFRGFADGIDDFGIVITAGPNSDHDAGTAGRAAVIFEAAEFDDATNTLSAVENSHLFNFTNYGSSKMFIQNNGYVGIGTTSPSYPLEMGSGAHVTTGGTWTNASDVKLKNNINYIYPYGLSQVMKLKPVVFDYINGEKNTLGFIAQDVYEFIPEAISSTLDKYGNETMGLKMVSITSTLTKAIQEQQAIIESQATEIETLKTQIQLILTEIEQIKNN